MAATMNPMAQSIPGSFIFHHDHNYTNKAHNIFQPPAPSPSPSHRFSQIPRPVSRSSGSHSSRKRPRLDTNTSYFSRPVRPSNQTRSTATTPYILDGSYDHVNYNNLDSSTFSLEDQSVASPSPLANSEYQLAGGMDTPCASIERGLDELAQNEAERDYRFNRYTTANTSRTTFSAENSGKSSMYPQTPDLRTSQRDNRKRSRSPRNSKNHARSLTGWNIRSTAWALTGGLAGKMFNFCVNTAFGGFRAGGGDDYQIDLGNSDVYGNKAKYANSRSDIFTNNFEGNSTLPGGYPHDLAGFVEDYMNSPESRKRNLDDTPTAYHAQWDDRSAIKNDWQIINPDNLADSTDEHSPARKRSRASVAGGWQRPISRTSTTSRTSSTGASYASARGRSTGSYQHSHTVDSDPFEPVRRPRLPIAQSRRSRNNFTAAIGQNGQRSPQRPSSAASARQSTTGANGGNLSPDVVDYKRKMKAREKAQDENLRRLNAQLKDMIREGREALGSKFEIFDDHDDQSVDIDEGYYEDR